MIFGECGLRHLCQLNLISVASVLSVVKYIILLSMLIALRTDFQYYAVPAPHAGCQRCGTCLWYAVMNSKPLDTKASSAFLIATGCLLLLLSFGYRSGFGLFVKPISDANGRGREIISMALANQNLFWGIVAFFAGGLADRFGKITQAHRIGVYLF